MHRYFRRSITGLALTTAAVALAALPASAHIEPDVSTVTAGTDATVAFVVGHGCDGAATTKIEIKVPDGIKSFGPVDVAGWNGSVSARVVTYDGGNLPDHDELGFPVRFTAPSSPTTLRFPIIQTCGTTETHWISENESDEHPAPVVTVSAATAPTAPAPTTTAATAPAPTTTTATTDIADAVTTTTSEPLLSQVEDDEQDSGSDSIVPVVAGAAVAAVLVAGAFLYVRKRNADGQD